MQFICLFLLLVSLYGLMILVQKWLSVSYTQIPFVTLTSLLSVLYVAGLFGLLWHVSHLVFLTGLGYFALRFYKWTSCRHLADNNSLLPLAAFGVLYFISYFLWKNITFSEWDEFGWGIYTKIITTHDSLIAGYNDIPGADYPRISAILQYYFISFLSGGDFDEGTAIFAQTIIFSSAVPVFFSFRKHNPLLLVSIACCFYCLFYLFVLPICLIYNDSMLGLCWGMSVILYLINRNRDKAMLIITSICLFFLVQVKPIGIVFAFFTLFTVAIDEAFFSRVGPPAKLKKLGVLIAAVIVSWASWSAFKSYNGIAHSSVTLSLEAIYDFLSDPQDYQKATAENFLHSLIYTGGEQHKDGLIERFAHPFAFSNFSLSPLGWAFIFAIFMFLCCLIGNTSRDVFRQRRRHIALTMSLIVVLSMYVCLLLFFYMTTFSYYEAVRLASFGRYLGTAYLGIFLILFFTVTKNKGLLFAFVVLIFLFTPFSVLKSSASRHKHIEDFYGKVDPVIEKLKKDSESKTLVIDQGGNRYIQTLFFFRAFPLNTSLHVWSSVHPEWRDDWGIWQAHFSPNNFGRLLREYDYLVIWNDTAFWERYGDAVKRSQLKAVWALNDDRLAKINVDTIGVAASYRSVVAGDPIIRSDFDVYLDENVLSYLKVPCTDADTEGHFFLLSYPEHLERGRYDNTAFYFFEKGVRVDDKCIAQVALPAYEIDSFRTGQWVPYKGVAWEAAYHLRIEDKALALFGAVASSEPIIDSVFDVYPHRDKLIYFKEPCLPADTQDPFYLHLIPADEHDLPADRRADGFDRYNFVFQQYGMHFDGKCMALVPGPQYEIARIRTGQYVFDSEQRYISNWNREAVTRAGSEPKRDVATPIMSPPVPPRLKWTMGGNGEVALQWWTASDLDRGTIEKHQYRYSTDGGATWSNWTDIAGIEEVRKRFYYLETGLTSGTSKTGFNILQRLGFYYLVTGLTNGAEYTFQVRAENHAGTSGPSASGSTIPRADVPKTVRDFAAAAGNGRVTLTWANPNDTTITGYQYDLHRPRSEGGWTSMQQIPGSDATTTSCTVTGLTNDSLYVFIMQVLNRNGSSPKSRRIAVIPTASE